MWDRITELHARNPLPFFHALSRQERFLLMQNCCLDPHIGVLPSSPSMNKLFALLKTKVEEIIKNNPDIRLGEADYALRKSHRAGHGAHHHSIINKESNPISRCDVNLISVPVFSCQAAVSAQERCVYHFHAPAIRATFGEPLH